MSIGLEKSIWPTLEKKETFVYGNDEEIVVTHGLFHRDCDLQLPVDHWRLSFSSG